MAGYTVNSTGVSKVKRQRGILQPGQVERLLVACSEGYSGVRDRALIALQYRTGLRPGEALGLPHSALRNGGAVMTVYVEHPKGWDNADHPTPPREIGIDPRTADTLRAWLEARGDAPGPLFTNRQGEALSARYWRAQVARLGRRAGIERRCHPHGFRHSFAHSIAGETNDLDLTSKALGHSDLRTTQIYLSELTGTEEVISTTANRTW